jgi:hypothetical protein
VGGRTSSHFLLRPWSDQSHCFAPGWSTRGGGPPMIRRRWSRREGGASEGGRGSSAKFRCPNHKKCASRDGNSSEKPLRIGNLRTERIRRPDVLHPSAGRPRFLGGRVRPTEHRCSAPTRVRPSACSESVPKTCRSPVVTLVSMASCQCIGPTTTYLVEWAAAEASSDVPRRRKEHP